MENGKDKVQLLQYEDQTSSFPLSICPCCLLVVHLHLLFQLCFSQMTINTPYGSSFFLSYCILLFIIPFHIERSSPMEAFLAYCVPLSHHPSVTFYEVPWSMLIEGHYKYCVILYY